LSHLLNFLQDWPTGDMAIIKPEMLQCSLCGTKLCLVAQVNIVDLARNSQLKCIDEHPYEKNAVV
jgi:hypothetical protein